MLLNSQHCIKSSWAENVFSRNCCSLGTIVTMLWIKHTLRESFCLYSLQSIGVNSPVSGVKRWETIFQLYFLHFHCFTLKIEYFPSLFYSLIFPILFYSSPWKCSSYSLFFYLLSFPWFLNWPEPSFYLQNIFAPLTQNKGTNLIEGLCCDIVWTLWVFPSLHH